jgi:Beta protein
VLRNNKYVPILKGRDGEYGALRTLGSAVKERLAPLLEIPPVPWDFVEGAPAKTLDQHLSKVCAKIERSWGHERTLWVDLLWVAEGRMADSEHPVEFIFRDARDKHLLLVPVVGMLRDDEYLAACSAALRRDHRGVCLRLQREDFAEFPNLGGEVSKLLRSLSTLPEEADLILDLRALGDSNSGDFGSVLALIEAVPHIREWRSFTVAGTSFPANLTGLPPSDISRIPREEWRLRCNLLGLRRKLSRTPAFGDYGICSPEPSEVDPRIMRPSASIRYTADESWIVLKERNLRDHGYQQFHGVCRTLIQQPEYSGKTFSWGDEYISDCAHEREGPGSLTTWRKVGTSHHVAFVSHQLATEAGS